MRNCKHRMTGFVLAMVWGGMLGCRESVQVKTQCREIGQGDLVLTEIMANPLGADEGKEWFELYNASMRPLNLLGLHVESAKLDGSLIDSFALTDWIMQVGAHFVLGSMLEEAQPSFVDFAYATALRGLSNSGGRLRLVCGQTLVDQVVYPQMEDGVAYGFDGSCFPDASKNDRVDLWCAGSNEYFPGEFGTPGQANRLCEIQVLEGYCVENGQIRHVVAPQSGQLVITEIMPNPQVVADAVGEWIEIYSEVDFDLNAISLAKDLDQLQSLVTSEECLPVRADSYLVLARKDDPLVNGGLERVDGCFSFSLNNSNVSLFLVAQNEVLDRVNYANSYPGVSLALDPRFAQADLNDQKNLWCVDVEGPAYGLGDRGTPGTVNRSCDVAPAGKCFEGDKLREIRPAQLGQLVISEIMPNPGQVLDSVGEWIELHSKEEVDLNGLGLGKTADRVLTKLEGAACIPVAASSQVIFAASSDWAQNGGLAPVEYPLGFSLSNSQGSIVVSQAGVVLDQVTYGASLEGRAFALDAKFLEPAMNDDPAVWCLADVPYGLGDFGTPGTLNPSCGAAPSGQCWQNSTLRAIRFASPGEVLITEVMPDSRQVGDRAGEWFEIYTRVDFDLNSLGLSRMGSMASEYLGSGSCLPVQAGSYVLFAHQREHNGGLNQVDELFSLALPNTDSGLQLWSRDTLLDAVQWSTSSPGQAFSLDPTHLGDPENDDVANWCTATTIYGDGDQGSPGVRNPPCPALRLR